MDQTLTQEAIEAARLDFLGRVDEALDRETDEVIDIAPAVIARNVTITQLQTVPIQWFDGIRIALLTDGSLVVTDVDTRERSAFANALARQLSAQLGGYASTNVQSVVRQQRLRLPDGSIVTPNLQVGFGIRTDRLRKTVTATLASQRPRNHERPEAADPHLAMESNCLVVALNRAIQKQPSANGTVLVDTANADEWNAFITRDELPIKAQYLQWFADTNEIRIIECGSGHAHEALVMALAELFRVGPSVRQWLAAGGGSMNSHGPAYLPDLSYGPKQLTPGAVLPAGISTWRDFKTIKVEVGISQRWGTEPGQLDYKAQAVWAPMAGAEYVVCIKSDDHLTVAFHKLYDVAANRPPPLFTVQANPEAICPESVVALDARRVLSIPVGPLPLGFPDPFMVDLYAALVEARTNNI